MKLCQEKTRWETISHQLVSKVLIAPFTDISQHRLSINEWQKFVIEPNAISVGGTKLESAKSQHDTVRQDAVM